MPLPNPGESNKKYGVLVAIASAHGTKDNALILEKTTPEANKIVAELISNFSNPKEFEFKLKYY